MAHNFTLSPISSLSVFCSHSFKVLFHKVVSVGMATSENSNTTSVHPNKMTNMRCRVSKWHWHVLDEELVFLECLTLWQFKSRIWESVKALCSNTVAIFPPASSICGSLGQQSSLDTEPSVRGIQPRTKRFENAQSVLSYVSHHSQAENWENRVKDEWASQPLVLNCGRVGAAALGSHGHTRGLVAASLWNAKKTQTPQGVWWHTKVSVFLFFPLFSSRK